MSIMAGRTRKEDAIGGAILHFFGEFRKLIENGSLSGDKDRERERDIIWWVFQPLEIAKKGFEDGAEDIYKEYAKNFIDGLEDTEKAKGFVNILFERLGYYIKIYRAGGDPRRIEFTDEERTFVLESMKEMKERRFFLPFMGMNAPERSRRIGLLIEL